MSGSNTSKPTLAAARYTTCMNLKVVQSAPRRLFVGYHTPKPRSGQISVPALLISAARRRHPKARHDPMKLANLLEAWFHDQRSIEFEEMPDLIDSLEAHPLGESNPHPESELQNALARDYRDSLLLSRRSTK